MNKKPFGFLEAASAVLLLNAGCSGSKSDTQAAAGGAAGSVGGATIAMPAAAGGMPATMPVETAGSTPAAGGSTPIGAGGVTQIASAGATSASTGGATTMGTGGTTATNGGLGPDGKITMECQGFPLMGLKNSPGGSVLPNKCAPFDPTTNNPYAVRCIDAMPNFKTQFPGDEYCILPPPDDQGIQVGFHPQGDGYWTQMYAGDMSGYTNAAGDWVMQPGTEKSQNYIGSASNPSANNYYRTYFRMRTGSHHNIITLHAQGGKVGWEPVAAGGEALPGLLDQTAGAIEGVLGGQQRPDDGQPSTLDKPPEDAGLYLSFPASPTITFNLHHINVLDKPTLREGWVNIWWEKDARTLMSWFMGLPLAQVAMSIPPETTTDLHYSWTVGGTAPTRLIRVFGHRHFWTPNFSSWIERKSGMSPEIIYQSFDWSEIPTYRYDSTAMNPTPDVTMHRDGSESGILKLNPGDKLHFNCHIEYTMARASQNGAAPMPSANGPLHFANEAFKAEMCIEYGNVTGGALGLPGADTGAVPDFATK
jgi:hypothetical protein